MSEREQQVIDRDVQRGAYLPGVPTRRHGESSEERRRQAEGAARRSLRMQIARLEGELSAIVAGTFPHVSCCDGALAQASGPALLGLAELERLRDRLAGRVRELQDFAEKRAQHERRAREQLKRMQLEPGRYKFVRLPVSELGQGGCGVWEVRPRLGLIGMLAGWWQVKLSSGCPLPRGSRSTRDPDQQS